ncbi:MAG: class I SAM-dependent methyltransferase [Geminicoccaceae bacterium]
MTLDRFRSANRIHWNERAEFNLRTWDVEGFLADPGRLSKMVEADRHEVGEVRGRSLIHLQCHFGLDTLSWARLGAEVTGVDFAPGAIAAAIDLAKRAGLHARFVEADVYRTPAAVRDAFDIVYTSGGVLCWLPDISGWASVVSELLKPGGTFYIHEAHPVLWALEDERADDQLVIGRPYFATLQPKRWDDDPLWDEGRPRLPHMTCYEWSHGLGEIVSALIDCGLTIRSLKEHRRCLWQPLRFMVPDSQGWWRLPEGSERLPLMYSIRASKKLTAPA